jgi:23S rRNA (adenine2503-C2)-methyltransferase
MIYLQSLTQAELAELLTPISSDRRHATPEAARKRAAYRAKQIFHWAYHRHVSSWDGMTDLSKDLRAWLQQNVEIVRLKERLSQQALDGTHKFLWDLHDGKTIESVIIPAALQEKDEVVGDEVDANEDGEPVGAVRPDRFAGAPAPENPQWSRLTACISSQVGCAMACKFCLTGIQGLDRSLEAHEIVAQVHELRRVAPITNIVFMGMGEPLHNYENVVQAARILLDPDALGFSKRKITVSTSGLVPAIEKLGQSGVDVSLAISLNGTTDEQRSSIMPVNKKWNLDALMGACRAFPLGSHRKITFEYVLLKDLNDSLEDAARIIQLTRGIPSKINLIPFNEHPGSEFKRPTDETVKAFQHYLVSRGVTCTVRISRGRDILAACGQLRSIFGTARGTHKHRDWQPTASASS